MPESPEVQGLTERLDALLAGATGLASSLLALNWAGSMPGRIGAR